MHSLSRRLLAGSGAVAIAAAVLTGCADGGSGGADGVFTTIDGSQAIDVNAPLNPYNAKSKSFVGYNQMQLGWQKNSLTDPNAFYPGLAESWELSADGQTLTIHLQPKAKWSDGAPVTSADVKTSIALGITQGNALGATTSSGPVRVAVIDDKTLEVTQPTGVNSNAFTASVLKLSVVSDAFFGPKIPDSLWVDAATASDPGVSAADQTAAADRIAKLGKDLVGQGPKEDVSAGPFALTRVNPGQAVLAKNPHFYDADKISPKQVVLLGYSSNEAVWGFLTAGRLDAAPYTSTPEDVMKRILEVPGAGKLTGMSQVSASLAFNQSVKPFDDVRVRRGLAHLIDRSTVTQVGQGPSGSAAATTSGLIEPAAAHFLGEEASQLEPYAHDESKAEAELTAAGLSKKGGRWLLADGSPFTVNIQVPNGFSDWVAGGKSVTSQLTAAGIVSQLETSADYPTYLQEIAEGKYSVGFWLTAVGPGPFTAFQRLYGPSNGWSIAGANVTHAAPGAGGNWMGSPEIQTLDGRQVNPGELAAALATQSGEEQKQTIASLVRLTNQQLPVITMWDYMNINFVNSTRFTDFPPDDGDMLRLSPGVWMQLGYIHAKK